MPPSLWIDGDSCPAQVRDLIVRTAKRLDLPCRFIANRPLPGLEPDWLDLVEPPEEADDRLAAQARPGDVAVTRDIPLAARLTEAGVLVFNDRGTVWTLDSVRLRLADRDLMAVLRETGSLGRGRDGYGAKEYRAFAETWDRELTRHLKAGRLSGQPEAGPAGSA